MRVTADRKELAAAAKLAAQVAPSKPAKPHLKGVLLEASMGVSASAALSATATDLETSVRACVDAVEVQAAGSVLVDAARFHAAMKELDGERVELVADGPHLRLSAGGTKLRLLGSDAALYPDIAVFKAPAVLAQTIRLPAEVLAGALRKACAAADNEPGRYALHGVFVTAVDRVLRCVATNEALLARVTVDVEPLGDGVTLQVLVPAAALEVAARAVEKLAEQQAALSCDGSGLLVRCGPLSFAARAINGVFPPWERPFALVEKADQVAVLARSELSSSLRRVAVLGEQKVDADEARSRKAVKVSAAVKLLFSAGKLAVEGSVVDAGEASVEITCDWAQPGLEAEFLAPHLAAAVMALGGDKIRLRLPAGGGLAVIDDPDAPQATYILMGLAPRQAAEARTAGVAKAKAAT